jgi:hypothetical protein
MISMVSFNILDEIMEIFVTTSGSVAIAGGADQRKMNLRYVPVAFFRQERFILQDEPDVK